MRSVVVSGASFSLSLSLSLSLFEKPKHTRDSQTQNINQYTLHTKHAPKLRGSAPQKTPMPQPAPPRARACAPTPAAPPPCAPSAPPGTPPGPCPCPCPCPRPCTCLRPRPCRPPFRPRCRRAFARRRRAPPRWKIVVADTENHAIKVVTPASGGAVRTLCVCPCLHCLPMRPSALGFSCRSPTPLSMTMSRCLSMIRVVTTLITWLSVSATTISRRWPPAPRRQAS